jgi:DNA primase small subunit
MANSCSHSFIYNIFRDYYTGASFSPPLISEFAQREFGFFILKNRKMVRHKVFRNKTDLRVFLSKNVPSDVYRSAAYYEDPEAKMSEKGWLGADLVFDIDADHISTSCNKIHDMWICANCNFEGKGITPSDCPLCGSKKFTTKTWPCESCLDFAKEETKKLLDFLGTDFGFSHKDIHVFFSGHRGYHVHVENNSAKTLDTIARKEITDYVTGLGVTPLNKKKKTSYRDTNLTDFGWQKRLKNRLINFLSSAKKEDLKKIGIKQTYAAILKNKDLILNRCIQEGRWNSVKGVSNKTWEKLFFHVITSESSHIDTVVTTDTHRLIRVTNTLHGKTGFKKIEFPVTSIDTFDPFKEATAFNGGTVKVLVSDAPSFRIGDEMFGPYKNQIVELSTNAAVLLICKERAKLVKEKCMMNSF